MNRVNTRISTFKRNAGLAARVRIAALALAGLACTARADYVVKASAAGLTTVVQDGKCNLTEAIVPSHAVAA